MKYGVVVPFSDARLTVGLAREIEDAGWDGMFLPELVWGVDPWAQLAAAAAGTQRIRLGTMLTPLPWLRPWTVASQVAAVDHISNGRVILAVGLGAPDAGARGFAPLEMDRKARAELLDEGLDVLTGCGAAGSSGTKGSTTASTQRRSRPTRGARGCRLRLRPCSGRACRSGWSAFSGAGVRWGACSGMTGCCRQ